MSIAAEIANSIEMAVEMAVERDPLRPGRGGFERMTPAVYADLRRLAGFFMRRERGGHTLQPTAVVNEALLRLSRSDVQLNDAAHFYRLAAQTMRRVLVDHARQRTRIKRSAPGDAALIEAAALDSAESSAMLDVLDIDAALDRLASKAPRAAELLELRYFAGLEDVEISELCRVSRRTVERECRFGKAFIAAYLKTRAVGSANSRPHGKPVISTSVAPGVANS